MAVGHEGREWEHHHDEDLLIRRYFHDLSALIPQLPYPAINRIVSVCGNGGIAASASHMMCDINKGAGGPGVGTRPRVMALTDNASLISAWANDLGYERIFSEQLR